ncbi:MAG: MalY/PatB family protein [bacterium]
MKYSFDQIIDRYNTNSIKWDGVDKYFQGKNLFPMWVADMDFATPPEVIEALRKRIDHGVFGYTLFPDSYYQAIIDWLLKRHNWKIRQEWILYSPGVVPAVNYAIQAFTHPGDKVIVQTPVYYPFFPAVKNNGRQLVCNELKYSNDKYIMDLDELKGQIDDRTKMIILCSPHNPVGRVWEKSELIQLVEICLRNEILIVSDEIHFDLIYPGYKHTITASLSDEISKNTITCIAPSKTFNIAGLKSSAVIIENEKLRSRYNHVLLQNGVMHSDPLSIEAAIAAYNRCEQWLEQLLVYLKENVEIVMNYFQEQNLNIIPVKPQGTYLIWLDFRGLSLSDQEIDQRLLNRGKIALDPGHIFGKGGEGFQRINIACPRKLLVKGLHKIKTAVKDV